jgi:hypothetical protein
MVKINSVPPVFLARYGWYSYVVCTVHEYYMYGLICEYYSTCIPTDDLNLERTAIVAIKLGSLLAIVGLIVGVY